jgi:hypothetical protein
MSPTLLFVHSPVVGPTTWLATADVLRGNGFRCLVPDLTGIATSELVPQPNVRRQFIAEIPRLPLAYFLERAPVTPSRDTLQFAYMRFSPAHDRTADDAERLGWWVLRRDWDHLRMLTAPDAVADLVAAAVSALRAQ